MDVRIFDTKSEMAVAAAAQAAEALRKAIAERGEASGIAATGASQFEFLDALVRAPGIEWPRTTFFHLDEYVGLPDTHPASFRRYLRERLPPRRRRGGLPLLHGPRARALARTP